MNIDMVLSYGHLYRWTYENPIYSGKLYQAQYVVVCFYQVVITWSYHREKRGLVIGQKI